MELDASENFRARFRRWARALQEKFEKAKNAIVLLFIAGGGALGFALAFQSGGLLVILIFTFCGTVLGAAAFFALHILMEKLIIFTVGVTIATAFFIILTKILSAAL